MNKSPWLKILLTKKTPHHDDFTEKSYQTLQENYSQYPLWTQMQILYQIQHTNPKGSTQQNSSNKFSKVAGYKINIQKSLVVLYTNKFMKGIKKIPFL